MADENFVLCLAAHDNLSDARALVARGDADIVIVIYPASLAEAPHTHVVCRTSVELGQIWALLPGAKLERRVPGQDDYVLFLEGPGEVYRDRLFESLAKDESWEYTDYRYEQHAVA